MTRRQTILILSIFFISFGLMFVKKQTSGDKQISQNSVMKLYWFIPDGLRAEPDIFRVFQWAEEGKLPHIKKMMENGSYGYSIPSFPGHTPVNFATLLSGKKPHEHGVTDGPIRLPGYHVKRVSASGFRSSTRKVNAIWNILEQAGIRSTLLSVPGSTPPDSDEAYIFKGRWGGWGVELPALIFQSRNFTPDDEEEFKRSLHFEFGQRMTHFISGTKPQGWSDEIQKKIDENSYELELNAYENIFYALVYTQSGEESPRLLFSKDKNNILADIQEKEWSSWVEMDWSYRLKEDKNNFNPSKPEWEKELSKIQFKTWVRIKPIELGDKNHFRIRFLKDDLNPYLTQPMDLDEKRREWVGPFTDFPDNYPAQLIKLPEDKNTFLEEMEMSFLSHKKLLEFSMSQLDGEAIIHNIYSPNQMLSSRWWLGAIDPGSFRYDKYSEQERTRLQGEILNMYQQVDKMLGVALENRDENTVIVLSSDHGIAPLNYEVRLNNFFAKKGWLHFIKDKDTGELKIDWEKTKAVYLKMYHIYLNADGLGGSYRIQKDKKHFEFREKVMKALSELKGPHGESLIGSMKTREEAGDLNLDPELVGDILISNQPPFNWSETFSEDKSIFVEPKITGYKQAVDPDKNSSLWTPFIIWGPGIKKFYKIEKPIHHYEQLPVILHSLGIDPQTASLSYLEAVRLVSEKE